VSVRISAVPGLLTLAAAALVLAESWPAMAAERDPQALSRRMVIIKVDGLPGWALDQAVARRDARTGKSELPWIDYVFYQNGTRFSRFFVRGISLSSPSWSILDTGEHLQIKGNVEYDRFTMRPYDYLNFVPFYFGYVRHRHVDMPSVEVLDDCGIPLTADLYGYTERYQGMQLFQRGVHWLTLRNGLQHKLRSLSFGLMLEEINTGFELGTSLTTQAEREVIARLADTKYRYLDYFTGEFDHVAHGIREPSAQRRSLEELDALVGRIWAAIRNSPLPDSTMLVMVSDHGMNTDERIYSQGYNLVDLFTSAEGGGHHVVTNRHPMQDFKLRGLDPFVNTVITPSAASTYLKEQSATYPTALLDLDGNERAGVSLRNSDLNVLHLLLGGLERKDYSPRVHRALARAAAGLIDGHRAGWRGTITEMEAELGAVRRTADRLATEVAAIPKKFTKQQLATGQDDDLLRPRVHLERLESAQRSYSEYLRTLGALCSLDERELEEGRFRIEQVIAPRTMGDPNTVAQLRNYVVGWGEGGPMLNAAGDLDWQASFKRIDYFDLLGKVRVRNAVQRGVGNQPMDFAATRIDGSSLAGLAAGEEPAPGSDAVWIARGAEGLLLVSHGGLLRLLPAANLREDNFGRLQVERIAWRDGLPLALWENPAQRDWLEGWHTESEWLAASADSAYPNAVPSLFEHFTRHVPPALDPGAPGLSSDERLMRQYRLRTRRLAEYDLLVMTRSHWNFNVRNFNPGGNHGSFLRPSMHAVWLLAGGQVPRGLNIATPYDTLRFAPTVLALTGQGECTGRKLAAPMVDELRDAARCPAR
jgi:hypothetical protein